METADDAFTVVFFETTGFFKAAGFFETLLVAGFFETFLPPDALAALLDAGAAFFGGDFFGAGLLDGVFFDGAFLVAGVFGTGFFAGAFLTVFFTTGFLGEDAVGAAFFVGFLLTDCGAGFGETDFWAGFLLEEALDAGFFGDPDAFALREAAFFLVGLEGVFFTTPGRSSQTHLPKQ